jgi:phosphatidylinositol alpha-1,6-mannosyltransferase
MRSSPDPAAVKPAAVPRLRGSASRVVGIVARLARQKGIETLLDAVPRLLAAAPDTRVLIVGGPSRAALEARHAASASARRSTSSATAPMSRRFMPPST